MNIFATFAVFSVTALFSGTGFAAIATSGDFIAGSPTPTFTITTPIVLEITTSGQSYSLCFDEWVTSDGSLTDIEFVAGSMLSYQIDSGPVSTVPLRFLVDNASFASYPFTPNDGYMTMAISVTQGQILTILPATYNLTDLNPAFNSPPTTFNGGFYLSGQGGTLLAGNPTVPETSSAVFALIGSFVLIRRKR